MKRWPVYCFTILQVALLAIELGTSYDTWPRQLALGITNVATVVALLLIDRWMRGRGSKLSWLTWVFVLGAVWLDALGNFRHFYAGYWWWDRITHTTGGMALSAAFIDLFLVLQRSGRWLATRQTAAWFGFLSGQLLGAIYEISEWLGDFWFHTHRVVYTYDTPHDLFQNLVGGGLILIIVLSINRRGKLAK